MRLIIRLVLVSLAVGLIMAWLGITPADIYRRAANLVLWVGQALAEGLGGYAVYILAGASIVVPIWAVNRLLSRRRSRS